MIYELAALGAAFVWALSNLVSAHPSQALGAVAFGRARMAVVFLMLGVSALGSGGWSRFELDVAPALILSALVGIVIGDTALFFTMNRLGPRRTGVLFATNAPMSVALGWAFLGESLSLNAATGAAVTTLGVVLAILFGKRPSQLHKWEAVKGPLGVGVALGLVAALCQALGALIAKPAMVSGGVDAVTASALRVGVSAAALTVMMQAPVAAFQPKGPVTPGLAAWVALSGFLGMGVGMTLLLFALEGGDVGLVSTLSATAPALALPLIWIRTGERPALGAWIGAALVVLGVALIFSA